jgi:hypothetical protein
VKQSSLRRGGRALGQEITTLPDPPANRANESHVASQHSGSTGADCPIPRGIAMLIDILAREALKDVIAERLKMEARDDERLVTDQSGEPHETAIADPGVIKIKSDLLVAGVRFEAIPTDIHLRR